MIIYKPSDRIPIKLGDLTVVLSPLTFEQKADVYDLQMKAGKGKQDDTSILRKAMAYSVKDLKGAKSWDGKEFTLNWENGKLCNDCIEVLMGLPDSKSLVKAIGAIVRGEDIKSIGVKLADKGGAPKNV